MSMKGKPAVGEACLSWQSTLHSFYGREKWEPGQDMTYGILQMKLAGYRNYTWKASLSG